MQTQSRTSFLFPLVFFMFLLLVMFGLTTPAVQAQLVINEIDYDQPSTDTAEFIELKNVGTTAIDLAPYTVELVNGTGGGAAVYDTINLPAVSLAPGDYFVVCANATTVANCDLDDGPDTNFIQNGAPDAVGLRLNGVLVDAVSYEGDTGAPYTEGSGSGLEDISGDTDMGISRCPDGTDSDQNNADFSFEAITPGAANDCIVFEGELVINEIDYDQPGTDVAEFIELKNIGTNAVDLSDFELVLVNGTGGGASVYDTIALPSITLAPGDYYVICANAANTPNCDLDVSPDTNLIQNGAPDAVALRVGNVILDTVSYEGDTGAPYTEGSGSGLEDSGISGENFKGISRSPDGVDTDQNNFDFINSCITPGEANTTDTDNCPDPLNTPPDCSQVSASQTTLWPPNHNWEPIQVLGVTDADGDAVTITIDSIFQDEAVNASGSGETSPDGQGVGTDTATVRSERAGGGNGRVYHIFFTADDGRGSACTGEVVVGVPKSQGTKGAPVDDGALYDSTVP